MHTRSASRYVLNDTIVRRIRMHSPPMDVQESGERARSPRGRRVRRTAVLGDQVIELIGRLPRRGDRLVGEFSIPAARGASEPLTAASIRTGLVIVSTLPNIHKHACIAQVADLDEDTHALKLGVRIVHVSADHADYWREVDRFHPNVRAAGYTLCDADASDRHAFVAAFGVGVVGHHRIAHGLFGLKDGVFLAVDVPRNQMRSARVTPFLSALAPALR